MRRVFQPPFARNVSESRYPQLWTGRVGAWGPSLGPTGAVARDWSGRANHLTLTNMPPSTSWVLDNGYALKFLSTNTFAVSQATIATIRSVSLWFKPLNAFILNSRLCDWRENNGFSLIDLAGTGLYSVRYNTATLDSAVRVTATLNQWNHVVVAISSTTVSTYMNGRPVGSAAMSAAINDAAGTFVLGARWSGDTQFFDGLEDGIDVFNRELNAAEASQLYAIGRGGSYAMRERRRVKAPSGGPQIRRFSGFTQVRPWQAEGISVA